MTVVNDMSCQSMRDSTYEVVMQAARTVCKLATVEMRSHVTDQWGQFHDWEYNMWRLIRNETFK